MFENKRPEESKTLYFRVCGPDLDKYSDDVIPALQGENMVYVRLASTYVTEEQIKELNTQAHLYASTHQ